MLAAVQAASDPDAMRDQVEAAIEAGPDDPRYREARAGLLKPFLEPSVPSCRCQEAW